MVECSTMFVTQLDALEKQANSVLFRCKTVFPFTIFPTEVEVTETKVSIKRTELPFSGVWEYVMISDIVKAVIEDNPFFASLRIEIRFTEQNPEPIYYLPKKAAHTLQHIITGLVEANHNEVALDQEPSRKVVKKLESIGAPKTLIEE